MSDRSVSITIGTTGSIRHVNGVRLAGDESKDKMYEPKQSKKMIRVLTVIAYMFTVSFAAIMLSVYYVFIWTPRDADRRHYTDMSSKGAAVEVTNCPPPLDAERPFAPTIAASVNEFPTTPREELTTNRDELEPVTSRLEDTSPRIRLVPSSQSETDTQEDEDT